MNFTAIRDEVLQRCNLTSSDASVRVGQAVNRHYRRITSTLGMETTRFVTRDLAMTIGVRTVTFSAIEKIERVFDITTEKRPLTEISLHQMRVLTPGSGEPGQWAVQNVTAQTVTILLDTTPAFAWALSVDGWTTLTDLTGTDEPVFPASFHDVLTWFVLSEELLRKEKTQLAAAYEGKAEALLNDLRFHLADTHTRDLQQASHAGGPGSGPGATGGSGSGGPSGASHLINLPENTLVGRGDGQGTGISQVITLGSSLDLIGTVLHTTSSVTDDFTPVLAGTGGNSGQAYLIQTGRFVKNGKWVQCWGHIALATLGTFNFDVVISGFPFICDPAHIHGTYIGPLHYLNLATPYSSLVLRMTAATNYAEIYGSSGTTGSQTPMPASALSGSTIFMFSLAYMAA